MQTKLAHILMKCVNSMMNVTQNQQQNYADVFVEYLMTALFISNKLTSWEKNTIKPNQTRLLSLSSWKSLNPIRPDAFVSTPTKFKIGCLGQFFYTQLILYIWWAQNVKEQVSCFKTLDLVVVQSSATNLTNFENPKSI